MINSNKHIIIWLYTGCLLVFAMVVIGGITRLTGSGLSITEWRVITGTLPPLNDGQWQEEFLKYQQSPQFQLINSHFGLSEFKQIYWWEYLHRLIGRLLGMVFIIPFLYFLAKKQISKALLPKLILIFLLGAWQGFLGWYMVKSGLTSNPYVSHYRLAIHLINAFITFGYIFWVSQSLKFSNDTQPNASAKPVLKLSIFTFVLLTLQIIYGAFVAGLHAGHIYNTWPKMGDEWIASSTIIGFEKGGILSLVNDISVVQFIHRTLALVVFGLITYLFFKRKHAKWILSGQQKYALSLSMVFVVMQVLLGIFTLLYNVPVWLGVVHQAGAFVIFAAMIYQIHRLAKG